MIDHASPSRIHRPVIGVIALILTLVGLSTHSLFAADRVPDFTHSRPKGPQRLIPPLPDSRPKPPNVRFGNFRPYNDIDRFILARIKEERVRPKNLCDDATFARRASLDLVGITPTVEDLDRYFGWKEHERREKWVELLLKQRQFADHWTVVFGDLLRERGRVNGAPLNSLRDFLHDSLRQNKPYDQLVRDLIAAEGSSESEPAVAFILQDRVEADVLAVAISDAFLGVSLKCAQCHDHPFDWWTQKDFQGLAAFYGGTRRQVISRDDDRGARGLVLGVTHNARRAGGKFLTGTTSELGRGPDALAELVTAPDNPYFARVAVNRMWAKMMGVGLVNPTGNFSPLNPPSHPELLDWLALEFIDSGYNLKRILRLIALSRTYQQTSSDSLKSFTSVLRRNRTDEDAENDIVPGALFEGMPVRRMTAEQINDSILAATGHYPQGLDRRYQASYLTTYPPRPQSFLRTFGASDRETIPQHMQNGSIQQSLTLLNGDFLNRAVRFHPAHPFRIWRRDRGYNLSQMVEAAFYQVLTRKPTKYELKEALEMIGNGSDDSAWEDLQWALFNTREFQFIR